MRSPSRPLAVLAVAAALGLAAGMSPELGGASNPERPAETHTLLGSYLAGRFARSQEDTRAAAAYFNQALAQDPENELIIEQAFLMEAAEGRWDKAEPLARKLLAAQPSHRMAHTFLGIADFKAGRYAQAEEHFKESSANPIGELASVLARAWVNLAQGKAQEALDGLSVKQPEWAQHYVRYHRALIADLAGRRAEARASYERIPINQRTLRIALAYAHHAANAGDFKHAQAVLKAYVDKSGTDGHPMARELTEQIKAGERPPLLVPTPLDGLAEVFYGLGEALASEGPRGVSIGVIYLQFALYLRPEFPFALAALASAYETSKRYEMAIDTYDRIPKGTVLQTSIEIRKALNLNQLGRVDEAQKLLEDLARQQPKDVRPLEALGSLMRAHKRYAEAVEYYSRAIALIGKLEPKHWSYFYARGTSYERLKKWPLAEADLLKALKLSPDQALVLNYLGYSWIDQNRNLKQGLALIEKAVRQKPEDGYIVDSLGWAHYRLGNFKDAVKYLERAVELRPDDPVLNDHLGDVYWRVGREREARFQWEQALTLNPEPEDAEKIRRKLQKGLPIPAQAKAGKRTKEVRRQEQPKKSSETNIGPSWVPSLQ
jgi:tetratricopeptide (TPR) repeat protein